MVSSSGPLTVHNIQGDVLEQMKGEKEEEELIRRESSFYRCQIHVAEGMSQGTVPGTNVGGCPFTGSVRQYFDMGETPPGYALSICNWKATFEPQSFSFPSSACWARVRLFDFSYLKEVASEFR